MSFHGHHWTLDPEVTFLNHGSFGACPQAVLAAQQEYRSRLEREPVRFFNREAPGLLRISAQLYNQTGDYERLAALLRNVDWD